MNKVQLYTAFHRLPGAKHGVLCENLPGTGRGDELEIFRSGVGRTQSGIDEIAASLEALSRSDGQPRAVAQQWEAVMETMSADAYEFYREQIAENPDVLSYFERSHARQGIRTCPDWLAAGPPR